MTDRGTNNPWNDYSRICSSLEPHKRYKTLGNRIWLPQVQSEALNNSDHMVNFGCHDQGFRKLLVCDRIFDRFKAFLITFDTPPLVWESMFYLWVQVSMYCTLALLRFTYKDPSFARSHNGFQALEECRAHAFFSFRDCLWGLPLLCDVATRGVWWPKNQLRNHRGYWEATRASATIPRWTGKNGGNPRPSNNFLDLGFLPAYHWHGRVDPCTLHDIPSWLGPWRYLFHLPLRLLISRCFITYSSSCF